MMDEGAAELGGLSWPVVEARTGDGPVWLALPVGSTEQHGPHLPLDTDTRVAVHLGQSLARRRPDVVVAPALAYGASGEHAGFAGTLSMGTVALELVVIELIRSADAFAGTVVINGHGGNGQALRAAVAVLASEGRRVLLWSPTVDRGDAHAGRTETSIMLALGPSDVHLDQAQAGDTRPLTELMPELAAGGIRAVSGNGVLGDPSGASDTEGRRLLAALADDLADRFGDWVATWP
jgi:mycofactocin system creatininase family protein